MSVIAQVTVAHLERYGEHFEPDIVADVDNVAQTLHDQDIDSLLAAQRIGEPFTLDYHQPGWAQLELLDVRGEQPLSDHRALLLCLPHGRGLTKFAMLQVAVLSKLLPNRRIITVASPDGSPTGTRLSGQPQLEQVAGGDLTPLYAPLIQYLEDTGVENLDIAGCSYGSEAASWIAANVPEGLHVSHLILTEPPAVRQRRFSRLIFAFMSCGLQSMGHRGDNRAVAYNQALGTELRGVEFARRLLQLGTLAVGRGIAKGRLHERVDTALTDHPDLLVSIAAGERSELATQPHLDATVGRLRARHPGRVSFVSLEGAAHWLCKDVNLIGALVLKALSQTAPEVPTEGPVAA